MNTFHRNKTWTLTRLKGPERGSKDFCSNVVADEALEMQHDDFLAYEAYDVPDIEDMPTDVEGDSTLDTPSEENMTGCDNIFE